MNVEAQLRLSYYTEIANINEKHNVKLVQHTETGKIFVLKKLEVYSLSVYEFLSKNTFKGIPKIEEIIESENCLYIIEEYISGYTLREIIDKKGCIPEKKAAKYIMDLCSILEPFHSLNPPIVHRNIKPSNIIIDPHNNVYLIDFNSAKEISSNKTEDTFLMGTFGYAAPEQYGFSQSTPAADIYAIGVLLNELLTSRLPNETLYAGKLQNIIKKCIQLDSKNRYPSVTKLSVGIKKIISPITINSYRELLPPGFRSRNPIVIAASFIWYLFFISLSLTMGVSNAASHSEVILNRIFFFLVCLTETFWVGNYQNVWSKLPLSNSKNMFIKIPAIIIYGIVFMFALVLILVIITETSFKQ